jgi:hypothetical protein
MIIICKRHRSGYHYSEESLATPVSTALETLSTNTSVTDEESKLNQPQIV